MAAVEGSRSALALVLAAMLALPLAVPTARAQGGADEHATHHPDANPAPGGKPAGSSAKSPGPKPAEKGPAKGQGSGGKDGMMGKGGMMGQGGMGQMMKQMGAPKPRDLYPSLMALPDLPAEKRAEIRRRAHARMLDGLTLMAQGIARLEAAAGRADLPAMQAGSELLGEGLSRFDSGLAGQRALDEGRAPRNVALDWFRREMGLTRPAASEPPGLFGLSWFHATTMSVLVLFAVTMIGMYFRKMRRAEALLSQLTAAASSAAPATAAPAAPAAAALAPVDRTPSTRWTGELRLTAVFAETPDVRTLRLTPTDGGAVPFSFRPGQFLTLSVTPAGASKPVKRSYTIASSPAASRYCEITIKREPEGRVSPQLHALAPGARLDVSAPMGAFTFDGSEADSIVLIAGGVGITPMMSVVRYLTDTGWAGRIDLLCSCRTHDELIFADELEALDRRHPNLSVYATATRGGDDDPGPRGRLDRETLERVVPDLVGRRVHLCGPPAMMAGLTQILTEMGVREADLHTEAFGPASRPTSTPTAESDAPTVRFERAGKSGPLASGQTVLELAESLDVEIGSSCRTGTCGECKVRLVSGDVTMECDDGLEPGDRDAGLILACQATAQTDLVVDA